MISKNIHKAQTALFAQRYSLRSFAIEDRTSKIECSSHFSEINCSGTYSEWEGFENYRKLYPFPKYTTQAEDYKKKQAIKINLKEISRYAAEAKKQ